MAYREDEVLEMKPRDKKAPCKRWVIELEATTPSSVSSADFLIAASRTGSRAGLRPSPPSAGSAGGIRLYHLSLGITACMLSLESSAEILIAPWQPGRSAPLSTISQRHRRGLASVNPQVPFPDPFHGVFRDLQVSRASSTLPHHPMPHASAPPGDCPAQACVATNVRERWDPLSKF